MSAGPIRSTVPPLEGSVGGVPMAAPGAAEPPLEWRRNPWREDAGAALAGAAVLVVLLLVLAGFARPIGAPPLTLAVLMVLLGHALSPSWWPSRYRVDARGVGACDPFVWRSLAWSAIRRAAIVSGAEPGSGPPARPAGSRGGSLFVSTLARPGRLDAFRGMHLPIPAGPDGERLIADLRQRLAAHGY